MLRSSSHSLFSEAPRPSAKVCKSRFIVYVSVPEIPKGPRSHDPRDVNRFFGIPRLSPYVPESRFIGLVGVPEIPEKAPKPRSSRHSSFFETPRLSPEVPKSRSIGPVDVLEPPEGGQGSFPDAWAGVGPGPGGPLDSRVLDIYLLDQTALDALLPPRRRVGGFISCKRAKMFI